MVDAAAGEARFPCSEGDRLERTVLGSVRGSPLVVGLAWPFAATEALLLAPEADAASAE